MNIPHEFVLEALDRLSPYTKPMFGLTAVYVGDMIMFILRDRPKNPEANGIWVATSREHQQSLRQELPSMCSLTQFGEGPTDWQLIPVGSSAFEEEALRACELVLNGDPRIGKVPKRKSLSGPASAKASAGRPKRKAARKSKAPGKRK